MAVLIVDVEDLRSLTMNEFYDYNGRCYALTRSRKTNEDKGIHLEDFYEATVGTDHIENVPVVFVHSEGEEALILGWYKKATIGSVVQSPSLFLEGNVEAAAADAVLLPDSERKIKIAWNIKNQLYAVVEEDDGRYGQLEDLISNYKGANVFLRFKYLNLRIDPKASGNKDLCLSYCQAFAGRILENKCSDIREVKALELYARQASVLDRKDPDAWYYMAMACYHLGLLRDGMKAIEKALRFEPDASDLKAQKAALLISMGYLPEGAKIFEEVYNVSQDEIYLLEEGRSWIQAGLMEKGYECLKRIKNEDLLKEAGINISSIEKRWPFGKTKKFL